LLVCLLTSNVLAQDEAAPPTAAPAQQLQSTPEPADAPAPADTPAAQPKSDIQLQDSPPPRYTVKRGDTLWGISARFLKNPWKWPDVWGMNKDEVKNPHLIYPGDVIILDLSGMTPRLRLEGVADGGLSRWYGFQLQVSKMEPRMRSRALSRLAIPTIPAKELDPFLNRPLIVDPDSISRAPQIVATTESRVVLADNDIAYATGIDEKKGNFWNVYRPGRVFQDPDTGETLGHEAVYLADAQIETFGEISTVRIARAIQEVGNGDRLTVIPPTQSAPYIPRAPEKNVRGKVIAGAENAVSEMAPLSVVILNRGSREGLEVGHVLGLYRSEGNVKLGDRVVALPEREYGWLLVFRVFNKMSYGLVMTATRQVNVNDIVKNP